ncbi:lysyl oxidase family protein [Amycolatopsis magusensis]|uniref:lysyl oxidase family protein n=1 Tax=Amycolatopsis magusensis TaxID=882444 RepID=UPI00378B6041
MLRKYAALASVMLVTAITVSVPSPAATGFLLPDLRQAPPGCAGGFGGDPATCTDWDVCLVIDPDKPGGSCVPGGLAHAARLRFTSSEDNIGEGPLLLYGHRDNTGQDKMSVRQALRTKDGWIPPDYSSAQRPTDAFTYYEPARDHRHWHLMNFEHFALVSKQGTVVVRDRKNGFCLGDRYRVPDADRLGRVPGDSGPDGELAKRLRDNMCGHHEPSALEVVEGISVGSGDDYKYTVDYQWLDITGVASGVYDLVNTVNSDRTLAELDYGNNASSVAVSIQWPSGPPKPNQKIGTPPVVEFLRSCPGRPRCA